MSKAIIEQKVVRIQEVLNFYYPNPPIPLNHTNGFTFLVAVVLSAQTTDGKVNEVTKELFTLADNPQAMAALDVSLIQKIIQPVGLAPRKAASVSGLSKMIIEKFGGQVPNTFEDLESLPGVGHKTASVIMSQLFGVNAFAVDTHVHRLALRWGLSKEERNVDKVQADLCSVFPKDAWDKLHLQMIYFGREYCPAKNHKGSECPICCWINQPSKYPVSTYTASASNHNTTNTDPPTPSSTRDTSSYYAQFSPQKKAKGLVYYQDRIDELQKSPELAIYSQTTTSVASNLIVKEEETSDSMKCDLFSTVDVEEEIIVKEEVKKSAQGRKASRRKTTTTTDDGETAIATRTGIKMEIDDNISLVLKDARGKRKATDEIEGNETRMQSGSRSSKEATKNTSTEIAQIVSPPRRSARIKNIHN